MRHERWTGKNWGQGLGMKTIVEKNKNKKIKNGCTLLKKIIKKVTLLPQKPDLIAGFESQSKLVDTNRQGETVGGLSARGIHWRCQNDPVWSKPRGQTALHGQRTQPHPDGVAFIPSPFGSTDSRRCVHHGAGREGRDADGL